MTSAATALAANRDALANFDYVVLDVHPLTDLNIRVDESKGGTPDEEVNAWHRDLVELSAQKIMGLAVVIQDHGPAAGLAGAAVAAAEHLRATAVVVAGAQASADTVRPLDATCLAQASLHLA